MKIEAGKTYVSRDGKTYKPKKINNGTNYQWIAQNPQGGFFLWSSDGHTLGQWDPTPFDLVEEKLFVPHPVGTVRGPYHTANSTTRFMVQGNDGWIPFSKYKHETETECETRAREYAASITPQMPEILDKSA